MEWKSGCEDNHARVLVNDGFERGRAASTIFNHFAVHGDCFTFAATEIEVMKIRSKMSEWYDIKVRGVQGTRQRDVREMEILGRNLRWTEEGLEYEANDRHPRALLEEMGLCHGRRRSTAQRSSVRQSDKEETRNCWKQPSTRGSGAGWRR